MASAYQGAVEAVVAVVFCAIVGHWADRRLDSEPWGLFTGLVIGFAAFFVRLWRMRGLMETPPGGGDDASPP
jgi:F0F1-type ATP synthase assembly protein I